MNLDSPTSRTTGSCDVRLKLEEQCPDTIEEIPKYSPPSRASSTAVISTTQYLPYNEKVIYCITPEGLPSRDGVQALSKTSDLQQTVKGAPLRHTFKPDEKFIYSRPLEQAMLNQCDAVVVYVGSTTKNGIVTIMDVFQQLIGTHQRATQIKHYDEWLKTLESPLAVKEHVLLIPVLIVVNISAVAFPRIEEARAFLHEYMVIASSYAYPIVGPMGVSLVPVRVLEVGSYTEPVIAEQNLKQLQIEAVQCELAVFAAESIVFVTDTAKREEKRAAAVAREKKLPSCFSCFQ